MENLKWCCIRENYPLFEITKGLAHVGNSVRCSRKNMQMFPESLSSKITELFLDGNQITTLNPDHMGNLTNLSKL